jgi:hypothetical protein
MAELSIGAKSAAEVARFFRVHPIEYFAARGPDPFPGVSLSELVSFALVGDDLKVVGELR